MPFELRPPLRAIMPPTFNVGVVYPEAAKIWLFPARFVVQRVHLPSPEEQAQFGRFFALFIFLEKKIQNKQVVRGG